MTYVLFKFVHLLGVIVLVGNVTVSAVWKVFADRTGQPTVVAFAQRMVTVTDWFLTTGGVLLVAVGGYGMAHFASIPLVNLHWVGVSQLMFALSGLIWICIVVPTQARQTREVRAFSPQQATIPASYRALSRRWILWGVIATVPLIVAVFLMTSKL